MNSVYKEGSLNCDSFGYRKEFSSEKDEEIEVESLDRGLDLSQSVTRARRDGGAGVRVASGGDGGGDSGGGGVGGFAVGSGVGLHRRPATFHPRENP
uniref:Uncharacterized protein n=1 Tax=Vespula pensylvanica TaxID=30213 RepID=A0A834KU13_VESPE|nr:hypothetical protein H0235_012704 [Vespula pensylvanica]